MMPVLRLDNGHAVGVPIRSRTDVSLISGLGTALTELKLDDPNKHFVLLTDQESTMATSIRFDEYVTSMKGRINFGTQ